MGHHMIRAPRLYATGWESPHDHMLRCEGCYDPAVDTHVPEFDVDVLPCACPDCDRTLVTPQSLEEMVTYITQEITGWEGARRIYQSMIDNNAHTFDWQ